MDSGASSQRDACQTLLAMAHRGQLESGSLQALHTACDTRGAKGHTPLPSLSTVQRWVREYLANGSQALVPKKPQKDLSFKPWHAVVWELWGRPQKPFVSSVHQYLVENWTPALGGDHPPSIDQIYRHLKKRSESDKIKARHTGSAARSQLLYQEREVSDEKPFDEIHSDGWTTHFTAPHPNTGRFVTYEIWHFHDLVTRYVTPVSIGLTENTDVILQGLENAIRFGGLPARWQTDSTRSVKNQRVELDVAASLAERIGITIVHPITVGNSQANGIAEIYNRYLDECAKQLATYQNPKGMDEGVYKKVTRITKAIDRTSRTESEKRRQLKLAAEKTGSGLVFETHAQAVDWINQTTERFNHRPHTSLPKIVNPDTGKMVHMSPAQYLEEWRRKGWQPVAMDDLEIVDAFRPHVRRKVVRCSVTLLGGQRYYHDDLQHWTGQEVLVAVAPDDPRQVWIKDLEGRLICVATPLAAVPYRSESFREQTDRKRLEARVRAKEKAIARDISESSVLPAIESSANDVFELTAREVEPDAVELVPLQRRQEEPEDDVPADPLETHLRRRLMEKRAAEEAQQRQESADLEARMTWLRSQAKDSDEGEEPSWPHQMWGGY